MQSPTDPADRTGTIGVEAFDATSGAGFQASDDSPHAVECELVEDGGAFVAHRPTDADRPRRVEAARQQLQRLMRDAEADIAEALSNDGWLTVLDGPLHGIRHRRGLPVIGYVKTHHRRMLAREHWVRVPELTAGERSGLFAMKDALYGCYLRVGDPGPWAGPWAGIARLEMPSGIGRDAAVEAAERSGGLAAGLRVGSAPGRAGPGEPDADRGPRTASAPAAGGRTPCPTRGARGGARTQPRRTDGMIDDEGTHRARRVGGSRAGGPTAMRIATPRVEPRRRDRREPFEPDSRTASGAAGRPALPGLLGPSRAVTVGRMNGVGGGLQGCPVGRPRPRRCRCGLVVLERSATVVLERWRAGACSPPSAR